MVMFANPNHPRTMTPGANLPQQSPSGQQSGVVSGTTPGSTPGTGLGAIGGTTGSQVFNPSSQVGGSVPGQQQLGAGTVGNPMGATGGNLGANSGQMLQGLGKIPGPPSSTPAGPTSYDNSQNITDITKLYDDMLKAESGAWGQQQGLLQQQSNNLMRGAALTNARMGRSMGGGFASLQGSALGQGMNEMTKASLAYDERRRGLERDKFGKLLDEKHRTEERGWQIEDWNKNKAAQNERANMDYAMWYYEQTGQFPSSGDSGTKDALAMDQQLNPENYTDWESSDVNKQQDQLVQDAEFDVARAQNKVNSATNQIDKLRAAAELKAAKEAEKKAKETRRQQKLKYGQSNG